MYFSVKPHNNAIVSAQKTPSRNRNNFLRWNHKWDKHDQNGPNFFQLFCVL